METAQVLDTKANIKTFINDLLASTKNTNLWIKRTYNGINLTANRNSTFEEVYAKFLSKTREQVKSYKKTKAYRKLSKKITPTYRLQQKSIKQGVLSFTKSNPEMWLAYENQNKDRHGGVIIRYAARWANFAEARIAQGEPRLVATRKAAIESNYEGVGFSMKAGAKCALSNTWIHGDIIELHF